MRGRKPKPTQQKILEGNRGRRPLNDQEPQFDPEVPECPAALDGRARKYWDSLGAKLKEKGMIADVDVGIFSVHCEALATRDEALRHCKTEGKVIETPFGLKKNPWMLILEKSRVDISRTGAELGLSSSTRSRIKVSQQKQTDPFADYNKRRASIHALRGGKK